jgi:hypothetical protein
LRASRPDHRSVRSRRRRAASVCGGASYLAGYSAFVLGVASFFATTGAQALRALLICLAFAACTVVLLVLDAALAPQPHDGPLRWPACGTSESSGCARDRAAFT